MRRLLLIPILLCLCFLKAAAGEWTDAKGTKWTFYQRTITINGEKQELWTIEGAENYPEDVTVPEKVSRTYREWDSSLYRYVDKTEDVTIEAILALFGTEAEVTTVTLPKSLKYIGNNALTAYGATIIVNAITPPHALL